MDNLIKIFEVLPAEAERISLEPDKPHQHDFEELLIGTEGYLEHFIDFKSEKVEAPYISFVTKGKVHRVIPRTKDGKCHVWGIRFKSEFIPETAFHLYSFFSNEANVALKGGICFNRLVQTCEMMHDELQQPDPDLSVVKHLLSALFIMIESDRSKSHTVDVNEVSQNKSFTTFLSLLEENYKQNEGVEFYASKLNMTSRNLNQITQKLIHQSVSEIIETRRLMEAKRLMTSTDKTISEIAFEIGYNEKSYFTKVFKKKSGQTPTEFREEMKKLL